MAFSKRRRPLAEEEKCPDEAKARAAALEIAAAQELSSAMLYERLCRRYTAPAAASAVAEMVRLDYVNDERYAAAKAHALLCARKSRRAAADVLRQKGLGAQEIAAALDMAYAPDPAGGDPEFAAALALAERHYRAKLDAGRKDLVLAALQRRGFSWAVAQRAVRTALSESAAEKE